MMSLAVGHSRVNDLCVGVTGADAFMNATCRIENEDDESLDGQVRSINVFKGLNNTDMLSGALRQVATIKSAEDVGGQLVVPDAPEVSAQVGLPDETVAKLQEYKEAYALPQTTWPTGATTGAILMPSTASLSAPASLWSWLDTHLT